MAEVLERVKCPPLSKATGTRPVVPVLRQPAQARHVLGRGAWPPLPHA